VRHLPAPLPFKFPKLSETDAATFNRALGDAQRALTKRPGSRAVTIAVTYHKVTKAEPRLPNKDYRPLLGTARETLIGVVKKVAIGRYGAYILLDASLTRAPIDADEEETGEPGWTHIKPEGVHAVQIVRNTMRRRSKKKRKQAR
jgi:hypothetical protein